METLASSSLPRWPTDRDHLGDVHQEVPGDKWPGQVQLRFHFTPERALSVCFDPLLGVLHSEERRFHASHLVSLSEKLRQQWRLNQNKI